MTGQEMKDIHEAAEVRSGEVCELFSIALTTLYRWYIGEAKPKQMMMHDRAVKITEMIGKATEAGFLPVKDVVGKQRLVQIKIALRKVVDIG